MKKYISYIRVSTKEQEYSSLGIEAQKSIVRAFTKGDTIIKEFVEVESGRNPNRPLLNKAIAEAKKEGATLVIARLDRLARNTVFVMNLIDANIDFVCCDMPSANRMTLGIFALLAEEEARSISFRTKAALNEIKEKIARGEEHVSKSGNKVTKLGGTQAPTQEARDKAYEVSRKKAKENPDNIKAVAFIRNLVESGNNFQEITVKLNEAGFTTSRGGKFYPAQTTRLYERYTNN